MKLIVISFAVSTAVSFFTALGANAETVRVNCETEAGTLAFDLEDVSSIQNYAFVLKALPTSKTEIAKPKLVGQGLFDVSPAAGEQYLELPPYAARTDVTQFYAHFMSYITAGEQAGNYEEDFFCRK